MKEAIELFIPIKLVGFRKRLLRPLELLRIY